MLVCGSILITAIRILVRQSWADLASWRAWIQANLHVLLLSGAMVLPGILLMIPVMVAEHLHHRQFPWLGSLVVTCSGGGGLLFRPTMATPFDLRHLPLPRWAIPLSRHGAQLLLMLPWWILLAGGGILAIQDANAHILTYGLRWGTFLCFAISAAVGAAQWPHQPAIILVLISSAGAFAQRGDFPDLALLVLAITLLVIALAVRPAPPCLRHQEPPPPVSILSLQARAVREGGLVQALLVVGAVPLLWLGGALWVTNLPPAGVLPGSLLVLAGTTLLTQGWTRMVEAWCSRRAILFAYLPLTERRLIAVVVAVPVAIAVVGLLLLIGLLLHLGRSPIDLIWLTWWSAVLAGTNFLLLVKVRSTGFVSALLFSIILIRVLSYVQPTAP